MTFKTNFDWAGEAPEAGPSVTGGYVKARSTLEAEGYAPGLPTGCPPEAWDADLEQAAGMVCDCCSETNLRYEPWSKGDSYRALAVCRCGWCFEF